MMGIIFLVISIIFLDTTLYANEWPGTLQPTSIKNTTAVVAEASKQKLSTTKRSSIPKFKIVEDSKKRNIKRSVTVRLESKVSKETLSQIAQKIKDADKTNYKRTFILYYLSGMEIGMGAWATTHFNPGLEVRIQGLSLEDEEALKNTKENTNRHEIGSWISELSPAGIITIYKANGSYLLKWRYSDGSKSEKTLIKKSSSKGIRFVKKNNPNGDYYIINSSNNLEIWDNLGLISTMESLSQ